MAVKIRLTRLGKTHAPVYRIIAIDSRKQRDGKALENLGTYNPLTKKFVQYHSDRVEYWLSKGAILSDSVARLRKIAKKNQPVVAQEATAETEKPAAKKTASSSKAKTTKKVAAE
jgi:small subunit ribosomal protein S16